MLDLVNMDAWLGIGLCSGVDQGQGCCLLSTECHQAVIIPLHPVMVIRVGGLENVRWTIVVPLYRMLGFLERLI